jgi:hypothetical protein
MRFAKSSTPIAPPAFAAADVGIEKAKRLARLDRLDPQRHFGQLDRQRVAIDAVDAGAYRSCSTCAPLGCEEGRKLQIDYVPLDTTNTDRSLSMATELAGSRG